MHDMPLKIENIAPALGREPILLPGAKAQDTLHHD